MKTKGDLYIFLIVLYIFPIVSVIIPTKNRVEMLTRAIDSVLDQSYTNKIQMLSKLKKVK